MASVLVVIDGAFRFDTGLTVAGIADFTFSVFVNTLKGGGHSVTKAHRGDGGTIDAGADLCPFDFSQPDILNGYDVIWLFGHSGRNYSSEQSDGAQPTGDSEQGLSGAEVAALVQFMDEGGGVFATGDHDSMGSEMCGHIPRVRAMRTWYGENDHTSPMPDGFPRNRPPVTMHRRDTTQRSTQSNYGGDAGRVWFENQSDSTPQTITPLPPGGPAHPILRLNGSDITVFPDHMHEGQTLGAVTQATDGYDYPYDGTVPVTDQEGYVEFPMVAGLRALPEVIATGISGPYQEYTATDDGDRVGFAPPTTQETVNTLSVYDGRTVGVGRIVTGSTFHHYIDINLSGDSLLNAADEITRVGQDAQKGRGLTSPGAQAAFSRIQAVYLNITDWLARPSTSIQLVLERSTFTQSEANAGGFPASILVIVDGLKPGQFPGGGITHASTDPVEITPWAPVLTPSIPTGLTFTAVRVASDDPAFSDRVQRITFTYDLSIDASQAFGFDSTSETIALDATLNVAAPVGRLADTAWIELAKSANPFMLDLDEGNTTPWLSSDLRVFPVVAGSTLFGKTLPGDANRAQALEFLEALVDPDSGITLSQFESLPRDEPSSALSLLPTTVFFPSRRVYNFVLARVRLGAASPSAAGVRLFFRIFTTQTTAALTYRESPAGVPVEGYKKTGGASPIALPGTDAAGNEWLSFPMFAAARAHSPDGQTDLGNLKTLSAGSDTFFGALIDNNLQDNYLPATPGSAGAVPLPQLLMGEHQCIVAQIEFPDAPIPNGANPATSDKLSQRNIAFSVIANPGQEASRAAVHTFEIEATPNAVIGGRLCEEILLDWHRAPPAGTEVQIYIPSWSADQVVDLASRFYPLSEIQALDAHTIAVPGGGMRYVPIPVSTKRQTGVISVQFPPGVRGGQRFDVSVRQISSRSRTVKVPGPRVSKVSLEQAAEILRAAGKRSASPRRGDRDGPAQGLPRGVFEIGERQLLITDLRLLDAAPGHAVILEQPDPALITQARAQARRWRETLGAFQIAIPVSIKAEMLPHHLRLLSVLRWRLEHLPRRSRWHATFQHYVGLIADKVAALGGDPAKVPTTPDGLFPPFDGTGDGPAHGGGDACEDGGPAGGTGEAGGPEERWIGKISGLLFDAFGDFEGFTLLTLSGHRKRFFSREAKIRTVAGEAASVRAVVAVIPAGPGSRHIRHLWIGAHNG